MKILVLDKNADYTQRFQYYFTKKYTHTQISVCDNPETARKLIAESTADVFLVDSEFDDIKPEMFETDTANHMVFSYISGTDEIINGHDTIFKYHGISVLYSKICELYEKKKNRVIKSEKIQKQTNKKTEIITFLPVHGGAGSSSMAAACAISLASECNVLYLNLEQCPSDSIFFSGENKKGITDIVAFLKTKYTEKGVSEMLQQVIQKDQKQHTAKVSFIRGYTNIMDCMSMTDQILGIILKTICEKLDFRYVIIDADFIVSMVLQKLITLSDKLVFVSSGAEIANDKLSKIQRYLELLKRETQDMPENYLLLNQYYGLQDEMTIARNMEIIARFARYRVDNSRITSQGVIEQVLSKKDVFSKLKTDIPEEQQE